MNLENVLNCELPHSDLHLQVNITLTSFSLTSSLGPSVPCMSQQTHRSDPAKEVTCSESWSTGILVLAMIFPCYQAFSQFEGESIIHTLFVAKMLQFLYWIFFNHRLLTVLLNLNPSILLLVLLYVPWILCFSSFPLQTPAFWILTTTTCPLKLD